VNYDLPHVAEDYVHRIGRTGRAGAEGEAVSLVTHEERSLMAAIERLMNRKVESRVIPGFEHGTPSSEPREPKEHRQRPQQQRRPEHKRHSPQPQRHGSRGERSRGPNPNLQRSGGQRRGRPSYGAVPLPAPIAKERDAQIHEARARMVAEGEALPAAPSAAKRSRYEPQLGALLGRKRED
jgi:superfamily II DNA/RNA helicase